MRKFWIPASIAFVAVAIVSAQTLVEHATAAAGGTAAAAAGKRVSDGIDSVFGALGGITKEAAGKEDKNKPRRTIDPAPPIPEVRVMAAPAATATPLKKPAAPVAANKRTATPTPTPATVSSATEPTTSAGTSTTPAQTPVAKPPLKASDIATVTKGSSREDIAGKLGKPSSRLTMDDGGKLVEVYSYRSQGASIGSVRLVDGQVSEVRPAQ